MAYGSPIRLSVALTKSAREVASVLDRSLTEQVEHWARLGQLVETAVSASVTTQLKARSYAVDVPKLIAYADSAAGKAKAIELIRARNEYRYGADPTPELAPIYRVNREGKKTKLPKPR